MNQNNTDYTQHQEQSKPKNKNPFHALIPKGDYFFTPIILNINILIFVAMIATGVSPMLPDGLSLIKWGANFRPLTMNGEPWRLFTSMFLHFGIIHLATNMFAFYSLGRMLEPFIGKWRFIFLYLFAGLGGSAVSLWWHDEGVAAGASGAIFGLFGVFAALLTTNLIDPSIRKDLLKSIGSAILLNLLIGLYGGIDNAAHIGGLLTGAMGGYLCYFDLKSFYQDHVKKYTGLIISGVITAGIVVFFWMIIPAAEALPITRNEALFDHFMLEEKKSLEFIDKIDSTTPADLIQKNAVDPWQHNLQIVDSIKQNGLNEEGEAYFNQLRIYTLLRLKGSDEYYRAAKENRKDLRDSAKKSMNAADNTILDLQNQMQK